MFTQSDKDTLVNALLAQRSSIERSKVKAKNPRFAPIYDEDLRNLALLVNKVSSLEVENEAKVPARPANR